MIDKKWLLISKHILMIIQLSRLGLLLQTTMDNNEEYFESILPDQQQLLSGRKRLQYLQRQLCTLFQPFKERLLTQPIARIKNSSPKFTSSISRTLRNYLTPSRQISYLRGFVTEDYGHQVVEQLIKDKEYECIKKRRNTSVLLDNKLYWVEESIIKWADINQFLKIEKLQGGKQVWNASKVIENKLIDINDIVLELFVESKLLYARSARKIHIIDPSTIQIKQIITADCEIISNHLELDNNQVNVFYTTYQDRVSQVFEKSQRFDGKSQIWCKIDGLIHSLWNLTENSLILCKQNAIVIADRRKKIVNDLHRRQQTHQNRIYSSLSLAETKFGQRYFLTTQSFNVCMYDIRKPLQPLLKIPHYCQESPPSILQIYNPSKIGHEFQLDLFDNFIQQSVKCQEQNPLIIAHSPYKMGSSLLAELNLHWDSPRDLLRQGLEGKINYCSNKFQLLYDTGKLYQQYHPLSITPIQLKNSVGLFHIDNFHGICFQMFSKRPMNLNVQFLKKFNPNNFLFQRVNFIRQEGIQTTVHPNHQWFRNYTIQKYLQPQYKDNYWQKIHTQDEEDLQLQANRFEEKFVRYADLSKFYETIVDQSKKINIQQLIRQQQNKISEDYKENYYSKATLSQTQRNSQLSQRDLIHNQYLTDEDLEELLQQWDSL